MNEATRLLLEPPLGWWLSALILAGLLAGALLARRPLPRLLVAVAALPLLFNPVRSWIEREPERPLAIAVLDSSRSMALEGRAAAADAALDALRRANGRVEWKIVRVEPAPGEPTVLAKSLGDALGSAPPGRLGAVVVLSDGAIADPLDAFALPEHVPLHLLLAGNPSAPDRRLVVDRAPPFASVGGVAELRLRATGTDVPVAVQWSVDGRAQPPLELAPGESLTVQAPIVRRGLVDVAFAVPPAPGELTAINNRALLSVNGVRENLKVLLVVGAPYPGGRVWRDLLKSDGNIELTQFTILRLPSSFDMAPPDALSLIPFPVDQLFSERLPGFDLIIFDRFALSSLIGQGRLANVADYVRAGGALLVASGEEFGSFDGLGQGPLASVLPGRLAGPPLLAAFRPALTPDGRTHPVTAPLPEWSAAGEAWGRWPAMARVGAVPGAEVLMEGAAGAPLLMLGETGSGRVAFLASTGLWWWARDVDGPGPREALLRRLVHWLMREPELEAQALEVAAAGDRLRVSARGRPAPDSAQIAPVGAGSAVRTLPLEQGRGVSSPLGDGFYRVEAGGITRLALIGDRAEFDDPRTRPGVLGAAAKASGGGIHYLMEGAPLLRIVDREAGASGAGWIGVREAEGGAIQSAGRSPLVPAWAAWLLLASTLGFAWWKERG